MLFVLAEFLVGFPPVDVVRTTKKPTGKTKNRNLRPTKIGWWIKGSFWTYLVGGFKPFENLSQHGNLSPNRGENKKSLKPPPSWRMLQSIITYLPPPKLKSASVCPWKVTGKPNRKQKDRTFQPSNNLQERAVELWFLYLNWVHPPKINIEPENDGLEDYFPLPGVYSQVPC